MASGAADALPSSVAVVSYEVRAEVAAMLLPAQEYQASGTCATGTGVAPVSMYGHTQDGRGSGLGGGFGFRVAYLDLHLPHGDGGTFWGWEVGSGVDLDALYAHIPTGIPEARGTLCRELQKHPGEVDYDASSILMVQMPFFLGPRLGMGSMYGTTQWQGTIIGARWAPSFGLLAPSGGASRTMFNYLGAELTVDFASLDLAAPSQARRAQLRLAAFVLPPLGGDLPTIVKLSLGAVWY